MDRMRNQILGKRPALVLIGAANLSPDSPIKKYKRCPGTRMLCQSLNKTNVFDIDFVDEFRSSRVCGKCLKPFETSSTRFRFKKCSECQPLPEMRPATRIITNMPNREKQQERRRQEVSTIAKCKQFVKKNQLQPIDADGDDPMVQKRLITVWHRDISAARVILYKGNFNWLPAPYNIAKKKKILLSDRANIINNIILFIFDPSLEQAYARLPTIPSTKR